MCIRDRSIAGFALWIGTYLIGQLTPWMLQNLTPAGTFFLDVYKRQSLLTAVMISSNVGGFSAVRFESMELSPLPILSNRLRCSAEDVYKRQALVDTLFLESGSVKQPFFCSPFRKRDDGKKER